MNSTRIFRVLSQLTITELNRFIKFIESPYHNVNARINGLAVILVNSIKKDEKLPTKENLWKSIEVKTKYTDLKFRKLCNDLLERFEKFLIIENLESNKILQANLLLETIRRDKIEILAEKHMSKSSKEFEREIDKSSNYYLQRYFFEKTIQNLKTNYEKKVDLKKGKSRSYSELIKNLDAFYAIEKLRIATDIQTWKKMYKSNDDIELGIPLSFIDSLDFKKHPAVEIYKSMFKLYDETELTTEYFDLKSKAFKNIYSFPKDEQREIFDVLVSFSIRWVNKGDIKFLKETLELYDWAINEDIILNKGKLSPTTFRNYVVAGLRISEFDKVENFIKKNSILLDEERKENALNFNLARVSFYRRDYDNALSYLNHVNYDDIWYSLNSKSLLLAIYYELNEFDALENHLETYSTYLRREKSIQEDYRKMHLNFTKFVKKIHRVGRDKQEQLEKITKLIKEEKKVINKTWLLEKIDELLT